MSIYNERVTEQKSLIDEFFSRKQEIGKIEKSGDIILDEDQAKLITEAFAYLSAKLLKAELEGVPESQLNQKGLERKRRNHYSLASTISHIVNSKLESNMAKDKNYTPTLAEHLVLINYVEADLFRKSKLTHTSEDDSE